VVAADGGGVVCQRTFKTSNNCYRLFYKPLARARGLVVLLPFYGSSANEVSSAALSGLLATENRCDDGGKPG
jgi:hypothetical protein